MNIRSVVIAISIGAVPCAAFAGSDKHSYDDHKTYKQESKLENAASFDTYDKNNDDRIEEAEVMSVNDNKGVDFGGTAFDTLDENSDNEVSRDEWKEYYSQN